MFLLLAWQQESKRAWEWEAIKGWRGYNNKQGSGSNRCGSSFFSSAHSRNTSFCRDNGNRIPESVWNAFANIDLVRNEL